MKKLIISAAVAVISMSGFAQNNYDYIELTRGVLKIEKKAAIADVMQLTETESQPFWALYNEYEAKVYEVQNKRVAIIKDYADNYENITDDKADQLWLQSLQYKSEVLKLRKTYYKKFKKILPAGKASRFMQMENKIETLIDAQLAIEIPLIETK